MQKPIQDVRELLGDESFLRWQNGQVSTAEAESWLRWCSHPKNKPIFEEACKILKMVAFKSVAVPNESAEWQRLRERLFLGGQPVVESPQYRTASYRRQNQGIWLRFGVFGFAVLLLAFLVSYYSLHNPTREQADSNLQVVSTEYGQRATIQFPDGSKIVLNANSTLQYPEMRPEKAARSFTLKGEAYFEVASIKDQPGTNFFVHTDDGTVRVTGTAFVVYNRSHGTRVAVERGGVEVSTTGKRATKPDSVTKVMLTPGDLVEFDADTRQLLPQKVNIEPYTTWWHNQFILEQTPFVEIVQRLEETYGITVHVKDKQLLMRTLSGSIENDNLVIVTEALAKALRTPVQRQGQDVTFGKKDK